MLTEWWGWLLSSGQTVKVSETVGHRHVVFVLCCRVRVGVKVGADDPTRS